MEDKMKIPTHIYIFEKNLSTDEFEKAKKKTKNKDFENITSENYPKLFYTIEKMLIGFATSSSKASLKKGRSTAIVSLTTTAISHVLVRNLCSPAIFRTGKISSFISDK